jgi:hypothetical protein
MGVAAAAVMAAGLMAPARPDFEAVSDATATGLIAGLGVGGSFVLVLGLTIWAARQSNRARRAERAAGGQPRSPRAGAGRTRTRSRSRGAAGVDTTGYDPYPSQPYSAREPTSHKPYSRPYRVPAPDPHHGHAETNGHRPGGPVGVPTTPWSPNED